MELIYHSEILPNLSSYGIEIPILDERASKTFYELKKDFSFLKETPKHYFNAPLGNDLHRCHTEKFVSNLLNDVTIIEEVYKAYELIDKNGNLNRFDPQSQIKKFDSLRESVFHQVNGSFLCMQKALEKGSCFFLGGGMHHAMSFGGRGFCLVNDIVIGIRKLQSLGLIETAWVIDTDAHKGDGTAEICATDSSITTLSIHMKKGWPLDGKPYDKNGKILPWFIPSDIDLEIGKGEENEYLAKLEKGLLELEKEYSKPDIVIIVDGADPYILDELPSTSLLNLSLEQIKERDSMVYQFCLAHKLPNAWLMAGGYGVHSWEVYYEFLKNIL